MDVLVIQGHRKIAFEFRIAQKLLIYSLGVPRPTSESRQCPAVPSPAAQLSSGLKARQ